jgi:WD40 repeat protein
MVYDEGQEAIPVVSRPGAGEGVNKYEFDGFLSYRRGDATSLAQWIRRKLQSFRLPPEIVRELSEEKKRLHDRRPQIWLDTSYEKSNDDFLHKKIFPALDRSARLIVICTPSALDDIRGTDGKFEPNWLVREVDHFLGKERADKAGRPIDIVFGPGAIEGRYPGRLSEKKLWDWIDLRSFNRWRVRAFTEALDDGFSKLVASLYDIPERLLPTLRREERRRRQRVILGFAVAGVAVATLTTGLAIWGEKQRRSAVSALEQALESQAQMSVRLATEELQRNDPDQALATALGGLQTPSTSDPDKKFTRQSVTVIGNAIANQTFDAILREHSDAVLRVSLGVDGKSAITVGADGKAVWWVKDEGRPLHPIKSTVLPGDVFAISKSNPLLVSGSVSGDVKFWHPASTEPSPPSFNLGEKIAFLALNENGKSVAALGATGKLIVRDIEDGRALWVAPNPVPNAASIAVGSDCNCVVVGTLTGELLVWDLGKNAQFTVRGASGRMIRGAFGRGGKFFFATDDGRVWLTSTPAWPVAVDLGRHGNTVTAIAMSRDGGLAATASMDGTARIWNLEKREAWMSIKAMADTPLTSIELSPRGDSIALGHGDGNLTVWDISDTTDPSLVLAMRGHKGAILDLSFSPEGRWLGSASLDSTARVWRTHTARRPLVLHAHRGAALHATSRKGNYLISGGVEDKEVRLFRGPNWDLVRSISLKQAPSALAISDDGAIAVIGTGEGSVLQWETARSDTIELSRDNGEVEAIAFSPDQKTIVAKGHGPGVLVCTTGASAECTSPVPLGGWGYFVVFSEDGRWIGATSGGPSGQALVQEVTSGKIVPLIGHTDGIHRIRFQHDGKRAVTSSFDGTARIWDPASGKELVRLVEPPGRMSTAGFTPDGKWVATVYNNKSLRLWQIPEMTESDPTVVLGSDKSILVSDEGSIGQPYFDPRGNILAAPVAGGNINMWHVPDGTLRATLKSGKLAIHDFHINPGGLQVTATTQNGQVISWPTVPVLTLADSSLFAVARSVLPLSGSLTGRLGGSVNANSVSSDDCVLHRQHNVGFPPHNTSGAARARRQLNVSSSCFSSQPRSALQRRLIAEAQGQFIVALQEFTQASAEDMFAAELGLGDLRFIERLDNDDPSKALNHYLKARQNGVSHAASRLGWLALTDGTPNNLARAKAYFEEASRLGDADGFAGLAWMNDRFANSAKDVRAAFSYYVKAQNAYELDGDVALAKEAAEHRAMLAHLIASEMLAELFVSTRQKIASSSELENQ